MDYQTFKNLLLLERNASDDSEEMLNVLDRVISKHPKNENSYRKAFFSALKDVYEIDSLRVIESAIDSLSEPKFLKSVKNRTEHAIRLGSEDLRPLYKKAILREIELEFYERVGRNDVDFALAELDGSLNNYPYLKKTAYRRLKRNYENSDQRLYDLFISKLDAS